MIQSMKISDGSRTHHLEFGSIERLPSGDYTVEIRSPDDTRAHLLSVAAAVDGFMKVSARDARALRVEVHDHGRGRVSYAATDDSDDVSAHTLEEHRWEATLDDTEGHDGSKAAVAQIAFGAGAAYVALRHSGPAGERFVHRVEVLRRSRAEADDVSGHITPPGSRGPG